jgi:hypothetical protein
LKKVEGREGEEEEENEFRLTPGVFMKKKRIVNNGTKRQVDHCGARLSGDARQGIQQHP